MNFNPKQQDESRLCATATLAEIARFRVDGHGHDTDGHPLSTVPVRKLPITKTPRFARTKQGA